MSPLHEVLGICYTSSGDDEVILPAVINEDRYKVEDGYKITLDPTIKGFNWTHYYQSDLEALIKGGYVKIYIKLLEYNK